MRIMLIAIAVLALAGCARTAPILNVQDAAVTPSVAKSVQASQVRQAIMVAGKRLGWEMKDMGPGKIEGTLNVRGHTAVVDIPYSAKSYSILYKSSGNLNATEGTVHSNYNGWVQNLDRNIQSEIARL